MKPFTTNTRLVLALSLGAIATLTLLWAWGRSGAQATGRMRDAPRVPTAELHVCPTGCPYSSIQAAVDAANAGDVIKVALGTYTDLHGRLAPSTYLSPPDSGIITQVVYISKSVTIQGGYTTAFTDPPDPVANPTTLDAQGGGRVLFIAGEVSPTVEGLRMTRGDAAGLGGWLGDTDAGGGVCVYTAKATISDNWLLENTASTGGGLYLYRSDATLSGNTIYSNTAGSGGGLFLHWVTEATLSGNTIASNTASTGGGLYLYDCDSILSGNAVYANSAHSGGGLHLTADSDATLSGNTISFNSASNSGGGLNLESSNTTLSDNTITANTAGDYGGGLCLGASDATLSGNAVISNTANYGGGLSMQYGSPTLVNNLIAQNQAYILGSGLYVDASSPACCTPPLPTTAAGTEPESTSGTGSRRFSR